MQTYQRLCYITAVSWLYQQCSLQAYVIRYTKCYDAISEHDSINNIQTTITITRCQTDI